MSIIMTNAQLRKLKITIVFNFIFTPAISLSATAVDTKVSTAVSENTDVEAKIDLSPFELIEVELDLEDFSELEKEVYLQTKITKEEQIEKNGKQSKESEPLAENSDVYLDKDGNEDYYFIKTRMNKVNKARDTRKAYLKAKLQLSRYLNKDSKSIKIELSHFSLLKMEEDKEERIFFFKIKPSNIIILE